MQKIWEILTKRSNSLHNTSMFPRWATNCLVIQGSRTALYCFSAPSTADWIYIKKNIIEFANRQYNSAGAQRSRDSVFLLCLYVFWGGRRVFSICVLHSTRTRNAHVKANKCRITLRRGQNRQYHRVYAAAAATADRARKFHRSSTCNCSPVLDDTEHVPQYPPHRADTFLNGNSN